MATLKIRLGKKRKLESPLRLNLEGLYDKAEVYAVKVKNKFEALEMMDEPKSPEELWMKTNEILLDTAKEVWWASRNVSARKHGFPVTRLSSSMRRDRQNIKIQ